MGSLIRIKLDCYITITTCTNILVFGDVEWSWFTNQKYIVSYKLTRHCPYFQLGQGLIKTWNIYKWVFYKNVDKRWKGENVNECLTCLDMLDKRAAVDFIFGNIYVCLCCNCFMHHAWYLDKWYEVFFLAIKTYLSPISCCFLL